MDQTKRSITCTVYATPLMTITTDLGPGLCMRVSMFKYVRLVTWTSLFLGPQKVSWIGRGRSISRLMELTEWCYSGGVSQGLPGCITPVSAGYPLSVFHSNSTLKEKKRASLFTMVTWSGWRTLTCSGWRTLGNVLPCS